MSLPVPAEEDVLPRPDAAALPARVGRYQVVGLLGMGGTATVYLGRATGIGGFSRDVAIKVLHAHLRLDQEYVADFLREARLAARLRHPNVLPVLDVGESEAGVYLVMDWVDGASLAQLIEHMRKDGLAMPVHIALRIITDALSGLHAAHEMLDVDGRLMGLVHRDVSPQNLLLAATGNVLLGDFGIAKPTTHPDHTRAGVIKGKLPYMAPEQLRASLLDRRVDVWAAGIVCWELLAGRRAFGDSDQATLLQKVSAAQVRPLRTIRPDLSAALLEAVDRALAPQPDQRWASADLFRTQLTEAAKVSGGLAESSEVGALLLSVLGDAIEARRDLARAAVNSPPGAVQPAQPLQVSATTSPMRRRAKTAVSLGVALVLVVVVVAVFAFRPSHPIAPPTPQNAATNLAPLPSPRVESPPARHATIREAEPLQRPGRRPATSVVKAGRNQQTPRAPSQAALQPASPPSSPPPLADNPYK